MRKLKGSKRKNNRSKKKKKKCGLATGEFYNKDSKKTVTATIIVILNNLTGTDLSNPDSDT